MRNPEQTARAGQINSDGTNPIIDGTNGFAIAGRLTEDHETPLGRAG